MIDINEEKLIPFADVPALPWIPKRRGGTTLNVSTLFRWASHGRRGVKLEFVSVGASKCTTEAALMRFFERLAMPTPSMTPTPADVRRGNERAKAILARHGILTTTKG